MKVSRSLANVVVEDEFVEDIDVAFAFVAVIVGGCRCCGIGTVAAAAAVALAKFTFADNTVSVVFKLECEVCVGDNLPPPLPFTMPMAAIAADDDDDVDAADDDEVV